MKHILTVMAVSLSVAAFTPATVAGGGGATGGATEITQLLNNVELMGVNMTTLESLGEQIQSRIIQANQYVMQGQQYVTQMKQLQNLVPEEVLQTYRDAMTLRNNYEELNGSITGLYGNIQDAKSSAENIFRDMSLKGLTSEQYMAKLRTNTDRSREHVAGMLGDLSRSMKSVEASYDQVRKFQAKIPTTEGMNQSMQVMNSQMNAMIAQNGQLLELSMSALKDMAEKNVSSINKQDLEQNTIQKLKTQQSARDDDFRNQFRPSTR